MASACAAILMALEAQVPVRSRDDAFMNAMVTVACSVRASDLAAASWIPCRTCFTSSVGPPNAAPASVYLHEKKTEWEQAGWTPPGREPGLGSGLEDVRPGVGGTLGGNRAGG